MKIYYADLYPHKALAAQRRDQLKSLGFDVVSTWMDESHDGNIHTEQLTVEEHIFYGTRDLKEIDQCDMLVLNQPSPTEVVTMNPRYLSRGGRHTEFGYALKAGKALVVIGERENIFHFQPEVVSCNNWEAFISWLTAVRK